MCDHSTCKAIKAYRQNIKHTGKGGVACLILNHYNGQRWVALLGCERYGIYKNSYNLCSGQLDESDKGCFIVCLKRELNEEFKLTLDKEMFDAMFLNNQGKVRYIMEGGTPVFIGIVIGLRRITLNTLITKDNNSDLPKYKKEIKRVDYFYLDNEEQIEGDPYNVSTFAQTALKRIDVKNL